MLLRDASNSMDVLRQRYANSKHSSATTTTTTTTTSMSGPLTDDSLSNHELMSNNTTPTAGMTSFLPTLHSTPPMPTFQKPGMYPDDSSSPTSNITYRPRKHKNIDSATPSHSASAITMSTSSSSDLASDPTNSQSPIFQRRRETNSNSGENAPPPRIYIPHKSPETIDGYWATPRASGVSGEDATRASFTKGRTPSRAYSTTPLIDRVPDMASLPGRWNEEVDRLICKSDALGFDHARIVRKVRQLHPNVRGVLTPAMIDKRLRQLDQDIEIDYWRAGLPPTAACSVRESEDTRDSQERHSTREGPHPKTQQPQRQDSALLQQQQQQGEQRHQDWVSQYGSPTARGSERSRPSGVRRRNEPDSPPGQ